MAAPIDRLAAGLKAAANLQAAKGQKMAPFEPDRAAGVLVEVLDERERQHGMWGRQDLPLGTGGKPRITRRADGWQVECRSCSWLFWSRVLPHVQTEAARHECDPMEVR